MAQILMDSVSKIYRVAKRPSGLIGALKGGFARDVTKVVALNNISFSIDEGELVGYIGPNGAGKSTTVKILSGILVPDSGRCEIINRIPWKQRTEHVAEIGVVFGQRSQLWWDVPVMDSFELLRDIYFIPQLQYKQRLDELVDILDIESFLSTPVRQLSLGQRMRCELIAALLHNPRILFLDEPTIGLDAVTKLALRKFLIDMNQKKGVTMILTTHDMDDIEALCQRVMVIGHGQLLYNGCMDGLREQYAPLRILRAKIRDENKIIDINLPEAVSIELKAAEYIIHFNPKDISAQQMITNLAEICPIEDLVVEHMDVEELIANMYKEMAL